MPKKKTPKEKQLNFLESLAVSKARRDLFMKDPAGVLKENEIQLDPDVIMAFADSIKEELDKICPPYPKPFPYPPRPWPVPQPWPGPYPPHERVPQPWEGTGLVGVDPTVMNAAAVAAAAAVVSAAAAIVTAVTAVTKD